MRWRSAARWWAATSIHLQDWLAFSEILHAGSLIVDDVEDGARLRRGGPACHLIYGTPGAINSGTLAYFQVQFLIENSGLSDGRKAAIYKEYIDLLRIAHIGQGLDLGLSIRTAGRDIGCRHAHEVAAFACRQRRPRALPGPARDAVRSELRALERTFPQAELPTLEQFATLVIEDYY